MTSRVLFCTFPQINHCLKFSLFAIHNKNSYNCLNLIQKRETASFFTRFTAEQLWKGVTTVSKQGMRRGRGKGSSRRIAKDLNKGQIIGVGKRNVLWPGLNAPIIKGKTILERRQLAPDNEYQENLIKLRDSMTKITRIPIHNLDRGWSGTKMGGRWVGPPDPIVGEEFKGFDTAILFLKPVFCMKGSIGKTKKISVLTVTGNKNGCAGFAAGKNKDSKLAISISKNRSGQRLRYIELDDGSIIHDFYSRFGATKVFARKQAKGYGIIAHRCIRAICHAVGITDIHCKVEGSVKNYLSVTRAFFLGLIHQKSFQQMADEKRLNVVEFSQNRDNYPVVRAKPSTECRTERQIGADEVLNFNIYIHDGQVKQPIITKPHVYTTMPRWVTYTKKWQYKRSRDRSRVQLIARYGSLESFVTIREKQRIEAKRAALINKEMTQNDDTEQPQQSVDI